MRTLLTAAFLFLASQAAAAETWVLWESPLIAGGRMGRFKPIGTHQSKEQCFAAGQVQINKTYHALLPNEPDSPG